MITSCAKEVSRSFSLFSESEASAPVVQAPLIPFSRNDHHTYFIQSRPRNGSVAVLTLLLLGIDKSCDTHVSLLGKHVIRQACGIVYNRAYPTKVLHSSIERISFMTYITISLRLFLDNSTKFRFTIQETDSPCHPRPKRHGPSTKARA